MMSTIFHPVFLLLCVLGESKASESSADYGIPRVEERGRCGMIRATAQTKYLAASDWTNEAFEAAERRWPSTKRRVVKSDLTCFNALLMILHKVLSSKEGAEEGNKQG